MDARQADIVHCCKCFANRLDVGQNRCTVCHSDHVNFQRVYECSECRTYYDYEEQAEDCCCYGS